jgi:hypothetical protein
MSSVATTMLVDMVGEAGGLELAVLVGGAVLGVLLGGVARLGCSCGLVSQQHLMSGPIAISNIDGPRRTILGSPYCGTRQEYVVGARNLGNAPLQSLCRGWMEHQRECAW